MITGFIYTIAPLFIAVWWAMYALKVEHSPMTATFIMIVGVLITIVGMYAIYRAYIKGETLEKQEMQE
jgi:predicted permease